MLSTLLVYDGSAEPYKSRSEQYGFACYLMSVAPSHASRPIGSIATILYPAVQLNQIKFYFDDLGTPVGYIVWAYLADDVQQRYFQTGSFDLHLSEWNEGNSLWILDFVAPKGHLRYILRDLRDRLFREDHSVRYARVKRGRKVAKEISRASKSHFFKPVSGDEMQHSS
ncbi:MAG: toxin-activating lysine-acyltransferase [Burkholderiaceae bacterium]|nr:toxin-activating lysine-acyltransferase [Burkholderiaceae bacterium]MBY0243549.1 toxin-activating lysine-acyltransferase [Burkholderiaceae bacterium]